MTISKHSALGVVAFALAMTVSPAAAGTNGSVDGCSATSSTASLPATAFTVSGTTAACQPV